MSSLFAALQAVTLEQSVLLRTMAVAVCWTGLLAIWRTRISMYLAAVLGMLGSALVLRHSFPAFLLVNLVAFAVVHALQVSRYRWPMTVFALVALVAVFLFGRARGWDSALVRGGGLELACFYLDMWMLLRLVVLFWEVGAARQQAPALLPFLAWCCAPLFLAGPLLRFSHWPKELSPRWAPLGESRWWLRIVTGLGMVAGGLALSALVRIEHPGTSGSPLLTKALTLFFLGPWSFYWTIAGAFLFLASLGEITGLVVGPSFERPFLQANIADFWARWNMTATTVFREFLFFNRWGLRSFNPYVNTLLVFLAVGLWHGSNLYWISFGLLHGAYFCAFLWFRSWSGRSGFQLSRWSGILLTYFCVCTAWYLPSKLVGLVYRG